jgi:acetolactate synthase-1/2/3 large subunit
MLDYPVRHVLVRHEQGATHMADGYARAGGGGRGRDCDFGAWRNKSGHWNRDRDDGLGADGVHHGQVPSKLIGYDAFQETDITASRCRSPKHSYLVTRIEDIMPAMKEAFLLAKSGRPGPVAGGLHQGCHSRRR